MKRAIEAVGAWARALKRDAHALYLAARDPRTPLHAKLLAGLVAAYALSPIDLIPDFIPILGLLDDIVLVPLGAWLVLKLVPPALMDEHRLTASRTARPISRMGLALIIGLWAAGIMACAALALNAARP